MTNNERELEPIKRDRTNEIQRINLGWRGYVPGYKNKVTKQINSQIKKDFGESAQRMEKFPGGPMERPAGFQGLPRGTEPASPKEEQGTEYTDQFATEEENYIADQLASERQEDWELAQVGEEINSIYEDGVGHSLYPFAWNYIIFLFPLAFLNDAVDLLDLIPYVGWLLSLFASLFLSAVIVFTQFFFNGGYQEAKKYLNSLEDRLKSIENKLLVLTRTTRLALRTAKILRKVPGMKNIARQIPRLLVKLRKPIKPILRNPTIKLIFGAGLEAIPFISWVPWSTFSVLLAYLDEKHMNKQARRVAEDIKKSYEEALI